MMGKRRKPYEGGEWAIGACRPHPRPQTAREAAQRAQAVRSHYLPYAERQAATGRPWWAGIVQFYRHELAQLDAMTDRADIKGAVNDLAGVATPTPAIVTGKDGQHATEG